MSPMENITFLNISLVDKIHQSETKFHDRPLYFLCYQSGKGDMRFNFTFNVRIPLHWKGPTMNLTIIGRYVHTDQLKKTAEYIELLAQMPKWTDITAWLGSSYSYVI